MPTEIITKGFNEFMKACENSGKKTVYAMFSGEIDPSTGESWCPDCVKAEPVVEKCLKAANLGDDVVFILCFVGGRSYWKDPANEFRTHPNLKLNGVPTLMKMGTAHRLGESDCSKEDLVQMLFED